MIEKWKEIIDIVCTSTDDCIFEYAYGKQTESFVAELESVFDLVVVTGINISDINKIVKIWCKMLSFYIIQVDEDECLELMNKKRQLYSNRPLDITGQIGLVVRQIAKLCRLLNIYQKCLDTKSQEMGESIQDTINDIFNYCIIGIEMAIKDNINIQKLMEDMINECK